MLYIVVVKNWFHKSKSNKNANFFLQKKLLYKNHLIKDGDLGICIAENCLSSFFLI